jgi:predicted ester cyclase
MSDPKAVIERHLAAFNAKDPDADTFSADAEMVAPAGELHGPEQILAFNRVFWEAFPDCRLDVTSWIADGQAVAVEGVLTATHSGIFRTPDGDVPPTGRSIEFRWAALYMVRGDELVSEHLFFDQLDFLAQLGLAPGGPA